MRRDDRSFKYRHCRILKHRNKDIGVECGSFEEFFFILSQIDIGNILTAKEVSCLVIRQLPGIEADGFIVALVPVDSPGSFS